MIGWVALMTALSALLTTAVGLYEVIRKLADVKKTTRASAIHTIRVEVATNEKLDELLAVTRELARQLEKRD